MSMNEKYTGFSAKMGKEVSFSPEYRGYTFSEAECKDLLNGEVLTREFMSKNSKPYLLDCFLAEKTFNEHPYVGIDSTFPKIGMSYCNHVFTPEERETLLNGGEIFASDFVGSSGKMFSATLSYGTTSDGKEGYIFTFPVTVPAQYAGHVFTDEEKECLKAGEEIFATDFVSKKGGSFSAYVSMGTREDGKKGLVMRFDN